MRGAATALCLVTAGLASSGLVLAGPGTASAALTPVVTSGGGHSCALMPDQTIWCWGLNTTGQLGNGSTTDSMIPVRLSTLPPATDVSAGQNHTCAIDVSDQVWCWGNNAFGQLGNGATSVSNPLPVLVTGITATQVSVGDGMTCAVTTSATVGCWGDNNFGELGDGSTADASTPQPVPGLTGVVQVAAGFFHACALKSNGSVWCWGDNGNGELGNGTQTASDLPVPAAIESVTSIAAGSSDTCAIVSGGSLRCWGLNDVGQLGTGDFLDHPLPTAVVGLSSGTQQVTLGEDFGCAIASASGPAAFCWGDADGHGQLGNGSFTADLPVPVQVFGLVTAPTGLPTGPAQIAAGAHHACAVLATGNIDCWGQGSFGNLGDGSQLDRAIPVPVIGLPAATGDADFLSAGTVTGCAASALLTMRCWGQDVGDGSPLSLVHTSAVPVPSFPVGSVSQVATSFGGCAVVMQGGLNTSVRCWGDNSAGELGDNTTKDRTTPVNVHGLSGAESVTVGGRHACAVQNGSAFCWGGNGNGQLGDGTTTGRRTSVAVHGLPAHVAQISAGGFNTCALLTDGSVWCWGAGGKGQLGDGSTSDSSTPVAVTGLPAAVQIAVGGTLFGETSACALTAAGSVFCWGWNAAGQLGNGSTTDSDVPVQVTGLSSGVVAIADNGGDGCATLITAQVDCWGDNSVDELGDGSSSGISTSPVAVAGLTAPGTSLTAGSGADACAIDIGGQAQCWGWNADGQLGDGGTSNSDVPVPVQGL